MIDCEIIIQNALKEKRHLLVNEVKQILRLHQIPTPRSDITSSVNEAVLKAKEIGFPVVLKIISPEILHKSDVGGVILNVRDEKELDIAYEKLILGVSKREPLAKIIGVLVEKMMAPSTEVIVGGIRDRQFGPTIMFGIGGIFTEIYDDVVFRMAPINKLDASNLIHGIKGYKILEGARGKPPTDIDSIMNILINVSDLMMEHESIDQIDLNPIIVYSDSICVVDSRIILGQIDGGV